MSISVSRLNGISLDLYQRNNRKRNFDDDQNEKFDVAEDFDVISLDNKEKNKKNLQEAAELISKIQSYESEDFEKACGIYLTQVTDKAQVHHNKGILELLGVVRDFVSVAVTNTLRNFCSRESNLSCKDFVAHISSAISGIGRFCCDLCETISTTGNEGLKYSEVSCSWV